MAAATAHRHPARDALGVRVGDLGGPAPCAAARPSESACQAPSGPARIAAPLPAEPCPSNAAAAAIGQGRPSRISRSITTAPGP